MPAGQCASLDGEVTGAGQRNETIDTLTKLDGSSQQVINDLVVGTAQGINGQEYTFYYVNHSIWNTPPSGSPVAIKMDDLFLLQSTAAKAQNRYVLKAAFLFTSPFAPTPPPPMPP